MAQQNRDVVFRCIGGRVVPIRKKNTLRNTSLGALAASGVLAAERSRNRKRAKNLFRFRNVGDEQAISTLKRGAKMRRGIGFAIAGVGLPGGGPGVSVTAPIGAFIGRNQKFLQDDIKKFGGHKRMRLRGFRNVRRKAKIAGALGKAAFVVGVAGLVATPIVKGLKRQVE